MRARIILIGTNHPLQFGDTTRLPPKQIETYLQFVQLVCREHQIQIVAEEATPEGLANHNSTESLASRVALQLDLQYEMVDLTLEQRLSIGISDGQLSRATWSIGRSGILRPLRERLNHLSDQVREAAWVARTLSYGKSPALLIVGAEHIAALKRLLRRIGQTVVVVHSDYQGEQ